MFINNRISKHVYISLFQPPSGQFLALNGLRGLGSILIVSFHCAIFAGLFPLRPDGKAELNAFQYTINGFWVALDIFFVLSGFLIGRILIRNFLKTGQIGYKSFFTRRLFRIFPAYYFILTLGAFWYVHLDLKIANFFMYQGKVPEGFFPYDSWSNYLYLSNYLISPSEPNVLSWGWSLCVEEHFYLMLPPLLWLLFWVQGNFIRGLLLVAITLLPFLGRIVQYLNNPSIVLLDGLYFYSHNRFDEVLIGVLVAYFYVIYHRQFYSFCNRLGNGCWGIGVLFIGCVWFFGGLQETGQFAVVWQFLLMALGAGFLVANCVYLDNKVTRFFAHGFWYPFARISYGTYLIHPFVLFWLIDVMHSFGMWGNMDAWTFLGLYTLVMATTLVLAGIMFVVFEQPFIHQGVKVSQRYFESNNDSTPGE